ncbi:hypothetical protein NQ315_005000 [Exocentrus adspersus]|uniref:DNA-directed DNA polymerase n=1 Tax=Exocentrus adspersus TaxID=1586481 RepID=A0AAV8V7Z0_9CUCU|nr:hypothetical protein NQ315_005000 [Exocentrus adspersus]
MSSETITSLSSTIVKTTEEAVKLVKTKEEIISQVNLVKGNVKLLETAIKSIIGTQEQTENPFRLEGNLALLKYYLAKLQYLLHASSKVGGGLDNTEKKQRSRHLVWHSINSCFKGRVCTGLIANLSIKDPLCFLNKAFNNFQRKIKIHRQKSMLKVNVVLVCNFIKPQSGDIDKKTFATKNHTIDINTNLKTWYRDNVIHTLANKLEEFSEKDSGWALLEVLYLKVNINNFSPLKGGTSTYVSLPDFISRKRAVINVKNNDSFCFLWAVVSALYPAENKHPERITSYPHFKDKKKNVLPLSLSEYTNSNREPINLLVLSTENSNNNNSSPEFSKERTLFHFAWIKKICLNHFSSDGLLKKHLIYCNNMNKCALKLPKESDKILQFKHFSYKEKVPFAIYADLESILEPCESLGADNGKTVNYQKHTAFSVAYYLKCSYDDSLSSFKLYRNHDCISWFISELKDIAFNVNSILKNSKEMETLSFEQEINYETATHCHICNKPFTSNDIKVRDHCHLTSKYRGAAHQDCNLNYQNSFNIPVVFHNLSGYDSNFIMKQLATGFAGPIRLLPVNKEKYISFTKIVEGTEVQLRFIDSYRFMSSSLDKLSSYLEDEKKTIVRAHCNTDKEFNLLTRKGVFPYDYIDSWERFTETCLPSKTNFYSQLYDQCITDQDYQHALDVWKTFNIKTLGEYSDLYLKNDVLLLADIFENFRRTCLLTYELDPLHFYTAPGLAFDAMLKTTGVQLELLTDIEKLMFIERGIRGGVSQCSNRYAKANNKYMKDEYDSNQESTYLMYFDINNLYGAAMSEYLPYGEFEFLEANEIENLDIMNIPDNAEVGYIFDCDLEYPTYLHQLHSDLPLAPQHMTPPIPSRSKLKKLLLTLYPKNNYVVHYRNLKMYLKHGLRLKKINRVLRFKQSPWLKKYIDLNTTLRQQAKNDFDKNFYKLMINSVYGKLMENVRKYRDVRMTTKWEGRYGAQNYIAKPNFHSCSIFDDDMIIIEMNKLEILFIKPIYAGFCVLDISKTFLYEFHYDYIIPKFQDKAKLMYTDTDSLIYQLNGPDIYEHIKEDSHRFDTSDYEPNNPYGIEQKNKKVPGLMKDENNGQIMLEFVGLRAKMYAYKVHNDKIVKRSKGSTLASVKKISFDDYKRTLFDHEIIYKPQHLIRSKKHCVFTIRPNKMILNPFDDKRALNSKSTDTKPWGYERISEDADDLPNKRM